MSRSIRDANVPNPVRSDIWFPLVVLRVCIDHSHDPMHIKRKRRNRASLFDLFTSKSSVTAARMRSFLVLLLHETAVHSECKHNEQHEQPDYHR